MPLNVYYTLDAHNFTNKFLNFRSSLRKNFEITQLVATMPLYSVFVPAYMYHKFSWQVINLHKFWGTWKKDLIIING